MFLRPFTPEGTLRAAVKLLPHVAASGFDIVYLCPIALADDDMRPKYWSERQRAAGTGNPKNPYRIKDYFAIDPEYGSDEDLKAFVGESHSLGLRVILDIVYLHCGPKAVFIDDHPEFIERDESGAMKYSRWNFPLINYGCPELREYLWDNMVYFVKEFDVDGYRCDVAPAIPLDFWEEGRRRIEAIKSDVIMLSEGDRPEDQLLAFDLNWAFPWLNTLDGVWNGEMPASDLLAVWQKMHDSFPMGARFMRAYETHGNADRNADNRFEKRWGAAGVEAALFLNFMIDGVPFVYNGAEVADNVRHNVWANRFHGHNNVIDWSWALTEKGQSRLAFVRELIHLRHSQPALSCGFTRWLDNDAPNALLAFFREGGGQRLLCVVNSGGEPVRAAVQTGPLGKACVMLQRAVGWLQEEDRFLVDLPAYGFILVHCA